MNQTLIRVKKDTRIVNFLTIPDNDFNSFLDRNKEDINYEFYVLDNIYPNLNNVYRFLDNKLIIDKEETDNEKNYLIKGQLVELLNRTDFLVLPDYARRFTEVELNIIYDYRQSLREATTEIPETPDLISKYL